MKRLVILLFLVSLTLPGQAAMLAYDHGHSTGSHTEDRVADCLRVENQDHTRHHHSLGQHAPHGHAPPRAEPLGCGSAKEPLQGSHAHLDGSMAEDCCVQDCECSHGPCSAPALVSQVAVTTRDLSTVRPPGLTSSQFNAPRTALFRPPIPA